MSRLPTLETYACAWLARVSPRVARRSRLVYRYAVEEHLLPALGPRALRSLTRGDVRTLADLLAVRYAPNTVRNVVSILATLLGAALDDGLLTTNPARGLRLKHPPVRRQRAFHADETRRILDAVHARAPALTALYALCGLAGLRVGEAIGVRVEDVDLAARVLRVVRTVSTGGRIGPPKDGPRVIRIPPSVALRLGERRVKAGWYFPGRGGKPISYTQVRRVLRLACETAGIPPRATHALRRGFVSSFAAEGVPLHWLQRQVGHASVATTMGYVDPHPMDEPAAFAIR